ncbi:hypothetical protein H7849_16780 [Alloacidobacterium dinghuense]|uniref:Oligosaccharide repeat unit polymerase n=1 Tax=Alloacidobacterium dinghuense TaxID=2763107 RepID=A0A7G8BDZ7_9BACT|nr:hypothetical protein [Alloacidobacterium dinghuense]QNI30767.1 hypothetical protein H7849_16780 [Alloacidobacterium dinghuense]
MQVPFRQLLRIGTPGWVFLYCAAFHWAYIAWISPSWGYLGVTYKAPVPGLMLLAYTLPMILSAFSPRTITRPSQVIYWFIFFSVYVPALFVSIFVQLDEGYTLFLLQLSMTAGMLLIALSYHLHTIKLPRYPVSPEMFWVAFAILYVLANVAVFLVYRNEMKFAGIKEVYDVRFASRQATAEHPGMTYVTSLLANVMNPLLCAYGWSKRKYHLILIGCGGQVLLYMAAAAKSVLLSIVIIAVFYFTLKKDRGGWVPALAIVFAAVTFTLPFLAIHSISELLFAAASATVVRSAALPGLFIATYQYFFENFPHTYLSHVTGVNLFVTNPYEKSLGQEIGTFFMGWSGPRGTGNENASFFAMDGIAGFGLIGIPIIGIICAFMFWFLDSCARNYRLAFIGAALSMCMISLTNASLFTTLLGGGLLLWMLLFIYMPRNFTDA